MIDNANRAAWPSAGAIRHNAVTRRQLRIVAVTAAALVMALGGITAAALASGPGRHSSIRVSTRPTPTSLNLSPADVVALQMFTPETGVGIASATPPRCVGTCPGRPSRPPGPYYLASTADGGLHWTATARLPATSTKPSYNNLILAFVTTSEGYVQYATPGAASNTTWLTGDGGRTWSPLRSAGPATSLSLLGKSAWVTATVCPPGVTRGSTCHVDLLSYTFGAPAPATSNVIPVEGVPAAVAGTPEQPTLLGRLDATTGVAAEGGEGGPTSLLVTHDSGRHWQQQPDPCGDLTPAGFVTTSPADWNLYCSLAGGMNQGTVGFYTSTNSGQQWTLDAQANETNSSAGTISTSLGYDLTASGNGHALWLVGSLDDLQVSTDGGSHWSDVSIQTDGTHPILAAAGPTQAWLPTPTGLYHTLDGTTWKRL